MDNAIANLDAFFKKTWGEIIIFYNIITDFFIQINDISMYNDYDTDDNDDDNKDTKENSNNESIFTSMSNSMKDVTPFYN
jgi:cyclophilin family peptidyl-prolyl cis-trans isomerase